jgi:hemerythrin HHE cation binding domain-containing protein
MKPLAVQKMAVFFVVASSSLSMAANQPPAPGSMKTQHEEIIQGLSQYATQGAPTAEAAQKVLDLMKPHFEREEELVAPLLSLLPDVSEGRVTADMTFAIAAADRLKAERDELFDQHAQIQAAIGDLISAGRGANEQEIVDFATRVAAHATSEIEVTEPAAILVGDTVRQQLSE